MINIVQCSAAQQWDAGVYFLGVSLGIRDGYSVVKVWSLGRIGHYLDSAQSNFRV